MPRLKTESYKTFSKTLERSEAFLRLFDHERTQGRPSADDTELLRAAVVFAISALDSYLHDLVLEVVPAFGASNLALKPAMAAIARSDPGLALRVYLAPTASDQQAVFRTALDEWLESKSFQGVQKVSNALEYVGSTLTIDLLDQHTRMKTGERLQHYTDQRHGMIHRGSKPTVTRHTAGECVNLVASIASAIDADMLGYFNTDSATTTRHSL